MRKIWEIGTEKKENSLGTNETNKIRMTEGDENVGSDLHAAKKGRHEDPDEVFPSLSRNRTSVSSAICAGRFASGARLTIPCTVLISL